MTRLSDALKAANVDKLSTRAIEKAAERAGHSIHYSTVSLYMNGKHGEPDEPTLAALAAVLPVTLAELREAAGLPYETDEPYAAPSEAARMNVRQRRAVDEIIRLLVKAGEGSGQQPATTKTPDYALTDADGEARVVVELKSASQRELEKMVPEQLYLHLAQAKPGARRAELIAELDRRDLPLVPSPDHAVAAFGVQRDDRPGAGSGETSVTPDDVALAARTGPNRGKAARAAQDAAAEAPDQ